MRLDRLNLGGRWSVVGFGLSLPSKEVQWMLPAGLELCDQDVTTPGHHPVVLYFQCVYDVNFGIVRGLVPDATFNEHSVGIPFVRTTDPDRAVGPSMYIARMFTNRVLATITGRLVWGFTTARAEITQCPGAGNVNWSGSESRMSAFFSKADVKKHPFRLSLDVCFRP